MGKYLIKTVETYRVATEAQVEEMIAQFKTENIYDIKSTTYSRKEVKEKGEIVDEYYLLSVTKIFNDCKSPDTEIFPIYDSI